MKDKKGLSQIVTTVIIILLVIVAIALIWGVVSKLLSNKGTQITNQGKCIDINLQATKIVPTESGNYTVTVQRKMGGDGTVATAKLIFYNSSVSSNISSSFGTFTNPGDVVTKTVSGVANATKVDVNSYILDDSGKSLFCGTTTKEF